MLGATDLAPRMVPRSVPFFCNQFSLFESELISHPHDKRIDRDRLKKLVLFRDHRGWRGLELTERYAVNGAYQSLWEIVEPYSRILGLWHANHPM